MQALLEGALQYLASNESNDALILRLRSDPKQKVWNLKKVHIQDV